MTYSAFVNSFVYVDNADTVEDMTNQIKDDIVKRLSEPGRTLDCLTTADGQTYMTPDRLVSEIRRINGQVEVCLGVECRGADSDVLPSANHPVGRGEVTVIFFIVDTK